MTRFQKTATPAAPHLMVVSFIPGIMSIIDFSPHTP